MWLRDMSLAHLPYKGEHHRKQRKMFNPVFSSNHLRDMVPTFYEVSYKVRVLVYFAELPFLPLKYSFGMLSSRN
jgi:cytochrome P450